VWRLNEKQILTAAGMADVQASFAGAPVDAAGLLGWLDRVRGAIDAHGTLPTAIARAE
jgi:hypothetical protein